MSLFKRPMTDKDSAEIIDETVPATDERPFFSYLPKKKGFFASLLLKALFFRIKVDPSLVKVLKNLEKSGIVIFVNKYKSKFDLLFYHTRLRHEKLPYPAVGFDYRMIFWQPWRRIVKAILFHIIYLYKHRKLPNPYTTHFFKNRLLNGESGMVSLIEEKGFYRRLVESRTDPIDYLIEMQKTINEPIFLVPQLLLYDRSPQSRQVPLVDLLFGTKEHPGRLRRLYMILKNPKKIIIESADPVNLMDFLQNQNIRELSQKNQVVLLRRHLLEQINRHRQSIIGPALKSRDEIMEEVLTNPEMQKTIVSFATESQVPVHEAQRKAAGYLNEIASNYSQRIIQICDVVLRWALRMIFDGMVIDYDGLNRVKELSKKGPIILVPCHKSHLDYLILSYVLYRNNMPVPQIAAGKNLSFWPLGPFFRGGGAFFLRRSFKGEPLYPKIFSAYLYKILDEGFQVEFFIEGGRSRTGKLLTPKIGFLFLLWEAYLKSNWKNMYFVPVFIGYDRVLEEKAYVHELGGGKKTPENLKNIFKATKLLKKKYGKIYVNFDEPFSLKEYFERMEIDFSMLSRDEQKAKCYQFGEKIISAINGQSVITPYAIVAGALLNCSRKRIYYKQLMENIETYMNHLANKRTKLADTLFIDRQSTIDYVIDSFAANKYIDRSATQKNLFPPPNPIIKVHESKRPNLEYYQNNGIIHFIPGAYTALSILALDAFQFQASAIRPHYTFLKDYFQLEFIFDPDDSIEKASRKNIKAFIDDAILMPHPALPDTYNLTSSGFRKLQLFAEFLAPYFDSYWVVLNFYTRYTNKSIFDIKDPVKKIQGMGNRMYKRQEVTRIEGLSKINYKNAVAYFTQQGLINPEADREKLDYFVAKTQFYMRLLQR
jgi:glycerol-3-phosphate O-acyltransferase